MPLLNPLRRQLFAHALAVTAATLLTAPPAFAQGEAYPSRPVSLVVPYGPGGVVDITARTLAEGLSKLWGQSVVVENRPGAAGAIGGSTVAKAKGDGYTLFYTDDGVLVSMPHFNSNIPYKTLSDLKPVSTSGTYPYIVLANSNAGFKSLEDLIKNARANPGAINFATNGIGSTHHLAWERFQQQAKIKLNHVPYKSASPALQDVMAGHIPVMTVSIGTIVPVLTDSRVVPIANLGPKRAPLLPDVPTAKELGYERFGALGWLAVLAPGSTPDAIVEKISKDVAAVVATDQFRQDMTRRGVEPESMSPADLAKRLRSEYEQNGADIARMEIKPN